MFLLAMKFSSMGCLKFANRPIWYSFPAYYLRISGDLNHFKLMGGNSLAHFSNMRNKACVFGLRVADNNIKVVSIILSIFQLKTL